MYFKSPKFTLDQLHDLYTYDNKFGVLRDRRGWVAGNKIKSTSNKHVRISILGERYALHRVIWYYVTGVWPNEEIDHIDGNCLNNLFANLREVNHLKNMQNQSRAHVSNKSTKVLGVTYIKSRHKYQAQINIASTYKWLGYYDTLDAAKVAYDNAKQLYHL